MSFEKWINEHFRNGKDSPMSNGKVSVDAGWYLIALKHYCGTCERWFTKVQGKLAHERHKHK